MKLPIDIVPNTNPPKFVWQQTIEGFNGKQTVEHEGMMLPSVESAVFQIINMTKQLLKENAELQRRNGELNGRVTELSSRKAEAKPVETTPMKTSQPQPNYGKKR